MAVSLITDVILTLSRPQGMMESKMLRSFWMFMAIPWYVINLDTRTPMEAIFLVLCIAYCVLRFSLTEEFAKSAEFDFILLPCGVSSCSSGSCRFSTHRPGMPFCLRVSTPSWASSSMPIASSFLMYSLIPRPRVRRSRMG